MCLCCSLLRQYLGVVRKLQEYYSNFVLAENIATVYSVPAEHSFVTSAYGNNCR